MKDIDTLIEKLSRETQPQRAPRRPVFMFATWFLGVCAYVGLLLLVCFKPRPDLAEKLTQPLFMAEIASLVVLAAATSLSATLLSFPDFCQKRLAAFAPLGAFALFAAVIFMEWLADNPPAPKPEHSIECSLAIFAASLPPALWMFARIRRMAPVHPRLAGSTAFLAAFGVGALALRFSEQTDSVAHLMTWHYLPMIGVGILGLWLGNKLLRW